MPNIQVLDQNTINKIAAGEVIERPASVVKELLENAIDAQATAITVEIKDGGISFIRVTDDGCGIPGEEVSLAFLRHSTSKIRSLEDLFMVSSLGFRGEALSSIASVAQVELITRTPGSLSGTRFQIEGGVEKGREEIGAPEGTTFLVRNLFYNTPVRKKFLKTAMTEGAHVAELVEKLALSHPEISFRFIQNNQNKLFTSGNHNLKDIIYTIYGREIVKGLIPANQSSGLLTIGGFIGKPEIARSNRSFENYFINGRYIKSAIIGKAIEEAYKPFMMQRRYPFTMLQLSIEPELLDVNVHPTKMELRFQDGEMVFSQVRDAVSRALRQEELIPKVSLDERERKEEEKKLLSERRERYRLTPEPFEQRRPGFEREKRGELKPAFPMPSLLREAKASYQAPSNPDGQTECQPPADKKPDHTAEPQSYANLNQDKTRIFVNKMPEGGKALQPQDFAGCQEPQETEQLDLFSERLLNPESRLRHRLIGQLFDTYWLVEFNQQLFIIDQHAAHEKVLYERTMAAIRARKASSQMLDPPIILSLNMREEELLKKHLSCFCDLGFVIEHFGGRDYAVRGVPDNLPSIAKKELFIEMLDGLSEEKALADSEMVYEKVASMSCKAAVKGNSALSAAEADRLIDQLLCLDNPYACPHGRPTIISMSKYEIEKKFKRIVS